MRINTSPIYMPRFSAKPASTPSTKKEPFFTDRKVAVALGSGVMLSALVQTIFGGDNTFRELLTASIGMIAGFAFSHRNVQREIAAQNKKNNTTE